MELAPLEKLGPDRFQELVQALLIPEFPGLQCLPVGARDGGRDALQRMGGAQTIVQVKYSRNPGRITKPTEWVLKAIAEEADKIRLQTRRGATVYVLAVNVHGTATLDTGSIDVVQRHIQEQFGLTGLCLWRADIERRLEARPGVRAAFTELLTAGDVLRAIQQSDDAVHGARRLTLKAHLAMRYDREGRVRFNQTELDEDIVKLFVDLPQVPSLHRQYMPRKRNELLERYSRVATNLEAQKPSISRALRNRSAAREVPTCLAAHSILDLAFGEEFPVIVLQGGPGQGKSTIAQFVCQLHRARLLNQASSIATLERAYRNSPVRLPLKIELRDYAEWLSQRSPFGPAVDLPQDWHPSLESFLSASIKVDAGAGEFGPDDLRATLSETETLLVLDGLDEVPDVTARARVVEEVGAAITRLLQVGKNLRVLLTTRPSAFANSPGFDEDRYVHFSLVDLPLEVSQEYAIKWTTARRMQSNDAAKIQGLLKDRLSLPHFRDLARNPMQLAILLSLLVTHGESLPDKRTELYEEYMSRFLARESEKNPTVRDNRDLLTRIHGHLAWVMHSEAEAGTTNGRIAAADLRDCLLDFLHRDGSPTEIVDELFIGVVERVYALVQRIEGTYEFEVQPVREYFCGRHLYHTAAYVPATRARIGSRSDRFDAIARNPYWLNVARFMAGFYTEGELAGLADALERLYDDSHLGETSHPRAVIESLLRDYVFELQPRIRQRVVHLLLRDLGFRTALAYDEGGHFSLAGRAGGVQIGETAWAERQRWTGDRRMHLGLLAGANLDPSRSLHIWIEALQESGLSSELWLDGRYLGVTDVLDHSKVIELARSVPDDDAHLFALIAADYPAVLSGDPSLAHRTLTTTFKERSYPWTPDFEDPIAYLGMLLNAIESPTAFNPTNPRPIDDIRRHWPLPPIDSVRTPTTPIGRIVRSVAVELFDLVSLRNEVWQSSFDPWLAFLRSLERLEESERQQENLAIMAAAVVGAGEAAPIPTHSILLRAIVARQATKATTAWHQYAETLDRMALLCILTFAPLPVVLKTLPSGLELAAEDREDLAWVARRSRMAMGSRPTPPTRLPRNIAVQDVQTLGVLVGRLSEKSVVQLATQFADDELMREPSVAQMVLSHRFREAARTRNWDLAIEALALACSHGVWVAIYREFYGNGHIAARQVMAEPGRFNLRAVSLAEAALTRRLRAVSVLKLSTRDKWFDDDFEKW